MLTLSALICFTVGTAGKNVSAAAYTVDSEIVLEVSSGRILFEKDADEKMYPASTTKVLTAICVIENADMEDVVAIDKNAVGIEGSSIYLREGEN